MQRQQFFIIAALAIAWATPTLASENNNQGSGWKSANDEVSGVTMSGRLYHNSADQNGVAPYVLLDRWGVVRGYVAPGAAVDLESYLGKQVSLQGSAKALPGGDMNCLTADRVLGETQKAPPAAKRAAAPPREHPTMTTELRDADIVVQPAPVRRVAENRPRAAAKVAEADIRRDADTVPSPRSVRSGRTQAASYQEVVPAPASVQPMPIAENAAMVPTPEITDPVEEENVAPFVESGRRHYRRGTPIADDCNCGDCACDSCDGDCDGLPAHRPLFCIGPTGLWVQADYLLWSERGMNVPALVTSGPNAANPGYLNDPSGTTQILFGNDQINDRVRSGGRLQAGVWMNACQTIGFEAEYFGLADQNTSYYLWSDGNPIVSRPFFDVGAGTNGLPKNVENVELVAFPRGSLNSVDGSIAIDARTQFSSESARMVFALCKCDGSWSDCCNSYHDSYHSYLMFGYRHLQLDDTLGIQENLTDTTAITTLPNGNPNPNYLNAFSVHDQFDTRNSFNGGELAMKFEFQRNRWWFDIAPRIALGDTHQVVNINGMTQVTAADGTHTTYAGGLLTQTTNIGSYSRNVFSAVPEVDLNVGYQVTPHARIMAGYNFIYWSNVVRAGDQIDTSVNSALLGGSGAVGGSSHPAFAFQQTAFWAQGVNVGLKLTW